MTKVQRKKWAIVKALELTEDGDDKAYDIITKARKKDDMADVFLMCYVYERQISS
jgi:hypothetical protein